MSKFFKTIKFIAHFKVYQIGEIASFPAEEAENLIQAGFAVSMVQNSGDASRLKAIMNPNETKNIPEAPETKHIPGPEAIKSGASSGRKCGKCGKVGHTRANCPTK